MDQRQVRPPSAQRAADRSQRRIFVLVLAAIAIAAVTYWRSRAWESTDNAQIDGFVFPVSSRVSGHVIRVMVDDNQFVEAGTVLVQLDPKDYEVAVAIAEGKLANDEASAAALMTGVPITSTDTASRILDGAGRHRACQRRLRRRRAPVRGRPGLTARGRGQRPQGTG